MSAAVELRPGGVPLPGDLTVPSEAAGLVVFAHGSGSSRRSSRNRQVAQVLRRAGLGTLLFDLLTEEESRHDAVDRSLRFDIGLLAGRLTGVLDEGRPAGGRRATGRPVRGEHGCSSGAGHRRVQAARGPVGGEPGR